MEFLKTEEKKREFIKLRAEGNSYSQCSAQLQISKSTCSRWESTLSEEISQFKEARLEELKQSYGMVKEARIRVLAQTLQRIDQAVNNIDFTAIKEDKLLELRLKYAEALKGECVGTAPAIKLEGIDVNDIITALGDLLNRVRAGDVNGTQAKNESLVLSELLKAYDVAAVRDKLEELERLISEPPETSPAAADLGPWKEVQP